jgi:hypothetical protein
VLLLSAKRTPRIRRDSSERAAATSTVTLTVESTLASEPTSRAAVTTVLESVTNASKAVGATAAGSATVDSASNDGPNRTRARATCPRIIPLRSTLHRV